MARRRGVPVAGQAILITGAARGIGAESARRLAARGARVALAGLEPELLEQVSAECPGSVAIECDVTDREQVRRAVDGAVEAFGGLDTVVANAGVAAPTFVRSMDPDAFERVIDVNVLGVQRTVQEALPHIIERRGYVLPVASMAALAHIGGLTAYVTSKAAVDAFADCLRQEVRHFGVAVGCAYFSWIDTEMVHGADRSPSMSIIRSNLKWPMSTTHPVGAAADAIVAGIERRSRWVVAPSWLRAGLVLRGVVQPLMDANPNLRRSVVEADAVAFEQAAQRGADASAMLGAGGTADERAGAEQVG